MKDRQIAGSVFLAIQTLVIVPLLCYIWHRLWQAKTCFTLKKRGLYILYFYTALLIFQCATAMPLWAFTMIWPKMRNNPWVLMTYATIYCVTVPTAGWLEACRIWLMFYDLQVSRSTTRQQWSTLISGSWESEHSETDELSRMVTTPFTSTPTTLTTAQSLFSLSPGRSSLAVTPASKDNKTPNQADRTPDGATTPVNTLSALFGGGSQQTMPADMSKLHASSVPDFETKDSNTTDDANETDGKVNETARGSNSSSSSAAIVVEAGKDQNTPTVDSTTHEMNSDNTNTNNNDNVNSEAKLLDFKQKRRAKDRDECDNWFINNLKTWGNKRYCIRQTVIYLIIPNSVILWLLYCMAVISGSGINKKKVWTADFIFTCLRTTVPVFVYLNTSSIDDFTFMRDEIRGLILTVVAYFATMSVVGMVITPRTTPTVSLLIYYSLIDLCILSRVYISCVWVIEKLRVKNLLSYKLYCGMRDGHMMANSGSSQTYSFPESMVPYLLRDNASKSNSSHSSGKSSRFSFFNPRSNKKQLTLSLTSDQSDKSDHTARSSTIPMSSSAGGSSGAACKMSSQRLRSKAAKAKNDLNEMLAVARKMRPEVLLLNLLKDEHGFEIFIAHLIGEFSSECLLGLVEFVQFKRSLVPRMKSLMTDRSTHCAEAVPVSSDKHDDQQQHHHHHHQHKHSDDSSSHVSDEDVRKKIMVTIETAGAATKSDCPSRMTRIQLSNMKFPKSVPKSYIVHSMLHSPLLACEQLYDKYLGDGSNLEVNVSFVCRLKIRHTMDELAHSFNPNDFDHCHTLFHIWDSSINELIRLMGFSISRFLDSEPFVKWFDKSGLAKTYAQNDQSTDPDKLEKQRRTEMLKQESIAAAQEILSAVL